MGSSKVKLPHTYVKPEATHVVSKTDVKTISAQPPLVTSRVSQHENIDNSYI